MINRVLEAGWRLNTGGEVQLSALGLDAPDRVRCYPSDWLSIRRALNRLHVTRDDVLVDFGAGRGRVVVAAARLPFRRVIGVELSPELAAVAQENLRRDSARRRCRSAEIVVGDAESFDVPDDTTVAHFFNPFTGTTFHGVIERLLESFDRKPRALRLVYNYPVEHDFLRDTGRLAVIDVLPSNWLSAISNPEETILIYRVLPRVSSASR